MAGKRGRPRKYPAARCPRPEHRGSHVVANGSRKSADGERRIYRCTPLLGVTHSFTVVITSTGPVAPTPTRDKPACPDHPDGYVVRDGTYGKRSPLPRQRYRCYPDPANRDVFHSFTPALPRQHIHPAGEQCDVCDEQRGVHHGEAAAARQHSWPASTVARGLEMLASGSSYADVSRWALRLEAADAAKLDKRRRDYDQANPEAAAKAAARAEARAAARARATSATEREPAADGKATAAGVTIKKRPRRTSVKEPRVVVISNGKTRRRSRASVEAKNVWHIAADWCEVFGPVIWTPIEAQLRERAMTDRARLDALKAAGAPLERPQVLLIDDMPVYGRDKDAPVRRRRGEGFFLLVAAEVTWAAPDLWDSLQLPTPTTELRLVRAFARSNVPAWRLVFDELDYQPDFIVADAGTGQYAAVGVHYPGTVFVPSMWHISQAIRGVLKDVPAAHQATVAGKVLHPELEAHLKLLHRGTPALQTEQGHAAWWDELLAWATVHKVPTEKLKARRRDYEPRVAAALPMLAAHPEVPISTGGLETVQKRTLEPVLAGRRWVFGNIERTNSLLDLAVAKSHGGFDDLASVARALRADATDAHGWAPPLRAVADPIGTRSRYSSLRDVTLLTHLAAAKGLT